MYLSKMFSSVVALALVGLAMHLRGGWTPAVYRWNVVPVNIDQHPERNWDWSDPPFLRRGGITVAATQRAVP